MAQLPRSLRIPKRGQNRKARITAKRRSGTGRLIARYRGDPGMERGRQLKAVRALFTAAELEDPIELIRQKMEEKKRVGQGEKCTVFEIGHGFGLALDSLALNHELAGRASEVQFIGMDALKSSESLAKNVRLVTGNILSKPFPPADVVFSTVALGYAGNIGFLVRKTANALKPHGVAALHINKKGRAQFSNPEHEILEGQMITLIQDMPKLARQLEKMHIPQCTIKVFTPKGWGGNIAVLIQKE